MDTLLNLALLGGFFGAFFMRIFGFNPFAIGMGVACLVIPLLTLFFQNNTEAALAVTNQLVSAFPLLIMESLGATLALGIFAIFEKA